MRKLLWISTQTRPDISFDICQLANRIKSTTENDLKYTLKVIKYDKNDEVHIKCDLGQKDNLHLVVYADASLANLLDQGSQSGYIIFLANDCEQCILLNWQSKQIKRIVQSSLSAETLAFADALDEAIEL